MDTATGHQPGTGCTYKPLQASIRELPHGGLHMGTPTWRPPDGNSLMEASIWKLRWVPLASQMRMKLEIDWWTPPQSTGPGNDHFEVETCLHGTFHMEASIRELPYGGPMWELQYGGLHTGTPICAGLHRAGGMGETMWHCLLGKPLSHWLATRRPGHPWLASLQVVCLFLVPGNLEFCN